MIARSPEQSKLVELLSHSSDGSLSDLQRDELARLLAGSEPLLAQYLSYVSVDFMLHQDDIHRFLMALATKDHEGASPVALGLAKSRVPSSDHRAGLVDQCTQGLGGQMGSRIAVWTGLAAALVVMAGTVMYWFTSPPATLFETSDAVWATDMNLQDGTPIGTQWLRLEQGTATFVFRKDARMIVEGPAEFRAVNGRGCELRYGILSVRAPAAAAGFSVFIGDATITDLGTAFRVQATEGDSVELHVTEGKVNLKTNSFDQPLLLSAGQLAEWKKGEPPQIDSIEELVSSTSSTVVVTGTHPLSLGSNQFGHAGKAYLFLERPRMTLERALRVELTQPGTYTNFKPAWGILPAGTQIRSYIVHFAPGNVRSQLEGSMSFREPIRGLICTTDQLNATNAILGSSNTLRCLHPERGLESSPDLNSDLITLSPDRKTVLFKFRTQSIDQLRILTRAE